MTKRRTTSPIVEKRVAKAAPVPTRAQLAARVTALEAAMTQAQQAIAALQTSAKLIEGRQSSAVIR